MRYKGNDNELNNPNHTVPVSGRYQNDGER